MAVPPLTDSSAVLQAIAEFDALGQEAFLKVHNYGVAKTIYVEHEGRLYDAKALAAVAYAYQSGQVFEREGYKGGAGVERLFWAMGFETLRRSKDSSREIRIRLIDPEHHNVYEIIRTPNVGTEPARKLEARLVEDYQGHLKTLSHVVRRHAIRVADGDRDLITDLFDETEMVLYEAKSKVDRDTIRYALGQILDYALLLDDPTLSLRLLVPDRPSSGLIQLLAAYGVGVTWRSGDGWEAQPAERPDSIAAP